MRIRPTQLAGSMRIAVLISAGVALVAMTTGLLLILHIGSAGHSAGHHSHDCSICRQFVTVSKKVMLAPSIGLAQNPPVFRENVPEPAEHVQTRSPQTFRPRGPPLSTYPLM